MQRKFFSIAPFRAADRHEAWSTMLGEFGLGSEPIENALGPFRAEIDLSLSDTLSHFSFEADNALVFRSRAQIRRLEWGQYSIYREIGPGARFDFNGREIFTLPGDLVVMDGDAPFQTYARQRYRHHVWMIPRTLLDPHLPLVPRPLAIHLPASLDICSFIVAYLDGIREQKNDMPEPLSALVADHIARLIALACGSVSKEHGEALRIAKLERTRRYVEQNLTARDLSPERTAAALGFSVRQLHLCFQHSGESFSQYVRRRRLQEARATLENPIAASRSISEVAFSWGFSSLPTFYRAFNRAFDAAPGDLREQALEAIKTPSKTRGSSG